MTDRLTCHQRIIAVLEDGQPHPFWDLLYAPGGRAIVDFRTRCQELEKKGYVFDKPWGPGKRYKTWRLVKRPEGSRPVEARPEPPVRRQPLRPIASGNAQPVGVGAAETGQGTLFP